MAKPVKYLVSGWYVRDGVYEPYKKLVTDEEEVKVALYLMGLRNDDHNPNKIDRIEAVWNVD